MSETEADEFFDAVETLDPDDQSNEPVKKGSSPTPASPAQQASSPVDPPPVEERWSIMMKNLVQAVKNADDRKREGNQSFKEGRFPDAESVLGGLYFKTPLDF
ncbi:Oidioi.mRNA.OKI2018_I69.XSR.g16379.t1.cds [Oikopleura dioica]|uniref:Oidioi.mRNA.OKI2018_I69.XSR.g16379.t1.cds n=1 Tax=Oikopleura dioica TaxID=34765 RepID=A0ABN7SJY0_OIKDI|nr:Oidioi.mRNA.OKI2018_I69.XSR.g16379.t1.cds [Oikopleura dioica]